MAHRNISKLFGSTSQRLGLYRGFASETGPQPLNTDFLNKTPETRVTTLPNGIRVATEQSFGETASIGVWVDSGSVYENEKNNGVAHFLEHMIFKGTEKRPSPHYIETEIENMGGNLNAFTSREHSAYYMKVLKENIPNAVDILSDILQNSKFEQSNIDKERHVILSEMQYVQSKEEEVIFDQLHAAAFQGSALGRTILGPVENINKISRNDIKDFISQNYTGQRLVIAAAGAVNHDKLVSAVKEKFGSIAAGEPSLRSAITSDFVGSELRVRDDSLPLVHFAVAVRGLQWNHPDYFVMELIQTMIGNWNRNLAGGKNLISNLAEVVATEGLAESYSTFFTCYQDTGLFGNYGVAAPERVDDLICEMLKEWQRIANSASETEVERNKQKLLANTLMQYDGTSRICEKIGLQMLTLGRRLSAHEIYLRITEITAADVRRVASQILTDVSPAVTAVGPTVNFPDYNFVRGWTYWNRL
ncbi:mitochondrial processing peptidase beta subunit [Heterostelium album PN500]|uniref:Mitochondrial processing peptidase beta subunit n=1 Tax=Heterostelium pallidum (strain ATCC 26659 / Pp 5 / PN500) TaxID=670386 RepID=D3B6D9_HETP5|nr:mitochondrial processing peptidase beta subunit [Heterostelium album PN500]EFA82909.1 mitochondrial processing peptidase beta subunit [Heterostelium album PN500]|eukprot:XP_020435026.1 mitochondrial processing peptidase beta subunit [Heterostelium album PN500]